MKNVIELTDATFQAELDKQPMAVVKFWMDNCGPCKNYAPIFDAVAKDSTDVAFYAINKNNERICNKLDVHNFPTVITFKNGKEVTRIKQSNNDRFLREKIEEAKAKEPVPPMTLERAYQMKGEAITDMDVAKAKLAMADKFIFEARGFEVRENRR